MFPYLLVTSALFHAQIQERIMIARAEIARIAAVTGPVNCTITTICRWAGKQYLYDRFSVNA
jgi:hypothetical protein